MCVHHTWNIVLPMKGGHLPFCTTVQTFEHKGGRPTKHAETLYKPQIHPLHNIKCPQPFHGEKEDIFLPTIPSRSSLAIVAFWPKSSQGNSCNWAKHNICANIIISIKASNTLFANARQSYLFSGNHSLDFPFISLTYYSVTWFLLGPGQILVHPCQSLTN